MSSDFEKRKALRVAAFVGAVKGPAKILASHFDATVFEAVLTRDEFALVASDLASTYNVVYAYTPAEESKAYPPSWRYVIILEDKIEGGAKSWPYYFKQFRAYGVEGGDA